MTAENILMINCRSSEVRYFPMYEIFLAGEIEKTLGIKVRIITVFKKQNPHFLLEHIKHKNDLIIFWEFFTTKAPSYLHKYFEIARFLKSHARNKLFFGGFWSTTHGRYFREFDIFDHLFEGYSIDKVVEKIQIYNSNSLRYLDARGCVDWDKYDLNMDYLYKRNNYFHSNAFLGYLSSFSCPLNCKFCFANSAKNDGSPFSARSIYKVKKDIDLLAEKYDDIEEILIKDLNFFYNKKRAFEILNYINSKKIRIAVNLDVTIYDINEEFLDQLRTLGINSDLYFGLESFNEKTRRTLGKAFTTERLNKTFEMMDKYGINLTGNIILGLPWQNKDEVEDAINQALSYMKEYKNVYIALNVWKPEYGTDLQRTYCRNLHQKLSFEDLIEVYKNKVSKYQEKLYGEKFNFTNLEKVHNCIRVIMRAKRVKNTSSNKAGKRVLEFIRLAYEKQLKEPYFRNKLISFTLERKKVDIITRYIFPLFKHKFNLTFFRKIIEKFFRFL